MSNNKRCLTKLHILWMSFWMRPYYVATSLLSAKVLEFYQEYWMLLGNKSQPQHYAVIEALHSFI